MNIKDELIPHLFRTEYRKIISVLCKLFGLDHIEVAEDITSETFALAIETWPYKGIPENPTAWLYMVAKNKTKNFFKHSGIFNEKIAAEIKYLTNESIESSIDLSEKNIEDSQLQMLFAICHPSISQESQIGLALRILCGFGIDEIANAFITNKETINKRLFRAKDKLRQERVNIELPSNSEINKRLDSVLATLYLLFNEGYYSESQNSIIRRDLSFEAMRLTEMLIGNIQTNLPKVNALFALMNFQASRFDARKTEGGEIILYQNQDETLWDKNMILKGIFFLQAASKGQNLTKYHLEASIAYWHTIKVDSSDKWENILQLYNHLLQLEYSPIAALNRTYALSKANGKQVAIEAAEKLKLTNNPYYFALLGELYLEIDNEKAKKHLEAAMSLTKLEAERALVKTKIESIPI